MSDNKTTQFIICICLVYILILIMAFGIGIICELQEIKELLIK